MFETQKSRWRALQTRNPLAASVFVYAVKTTGIYCRPTCPSRLARQANVTFFDSATDAECAGFRACQRCKPSQNDFVSKRAQHDQAVRKACKLMDAAGGRLTLENLASSVGLSPRYFHGLFKNVMGVTPSVYAMRVRKEKALPASLDSGDCEKATPSGRNEGRETVPLDNEFPSTEVPLNNISPGPETSVFGRSRPGGSPRGTLDSCFPGPMLFISENIPDIPPVNLDNGEHALSTLGHAELHDIGGTIGHGVAISSAAQLPDSFSFCNDLSSTCSWGWVV